MHYDQIPGWFDCEAIFEEMVARAPRRAVFVEVGAYLGRSTAHLASQIVRSGKDIRLHVVDLWDGWFYHDLRQDVPMPDGADVFGHFLRNMEQCGVNQVITPLKMHSVEAAALFDDDSVDFVWLDGDHGDEAVERDLRAWVPKVRWGGFI